MTATRVMGSLALWWLSIGAVTACQPQAPSTFVDRADIELNVAPDGSVEVREQFEVRVEDSPVVFERTVDHSQVDGLVFLGASLNGDELAPGGGDDLTVQDGATLRVRWKLAPGHPGTRHQVTLMYRGVGVVFVSEGQGRIEWPVLSAHRTFAVDAARVDLRLPAKPSGLGMVQPGWEVSSAMQGMIATGTGIRLAPAVVVAQFPLGVPSDRAHITVPAWQVTADLRREFAPALVSGALFMLVIGGGIIWMLRVKHPRVRPSGAVVTDLEERAAVALGLRTSGIAVGGLALVCVALSAMFLARFGWWGQLIPLSMALVAGVFYLNAGRFVR